MSELYPFVDVLIVGAGIYGTLFAARLEEASPGLRAMCVRLKDHPHPNAESLRNQGLLQSGMRYLHIDLVAAGIMRRSRSSLLQFCSMGWPEIAGVMQMTAVDLKEFRERIAGTPYEREVRDLTVDDAIVATGPFWAETGHSLLVPEYQLDVATVMMQARAIAKGSGIEFRLIQELEVLGRRNAGMPIRVRIDGRIVEAGTIFFLAGCGNLRYLDIFDKQHGYKTKQTALTLVSGTPPFTASVLYDKVNGFSISAHGASDRVKRGCMIIGAADGHLIDKASPRDICDDEANPILDRLERHLPRVRERYSMTAGREPIPPRGHHFVPQIRMFPRAHECRDIVFGFCGRATAAMHAVDRLLKTLRKLLKEHGSREGPQLLSDEFGSPWDDPIHTHYEDYYAGRSDYKPKSEKEQ